MAVILDSESIISMLAGGERGEIIKDKNKLRQHIEDLSLTFSKMSTMTFKMTGLESEIMDLQEFKAQTIQQVKDTQEAIQRINRVQIFTTGIIILCLGLHVCVYMCMC